MSLYFMQLFGFLIIVILYIFLSESGKSQYYYSDLWLYNCRNKPVESVHSKLSEPVLAIEAHES